MKIVAALAFVAGLVLAVRVMFFGVQRRTDSNRLSNRVWPLGLAILLMTSGAVLYAERPGAARVAIALVAGATLGVLVWWMVRRSAAKPSTDPEDDPRYRFQGHVARVVQPIVAADGGRPLGRIRFSFDGAAQEFRATWASELGDVTTGEVDREVVIERVENDVAYVEPWAVVEQRL